ARRANRRSFIKRSRKIDRLSPAVGVTNKSRQMNKIEEYKTEKDGLDVLQDVPRYAVEGWEAIPEGDRERLRWTGVSVRRQPPGPFMMRVCIAIGIGSATQLPTSAAFNCVVSLR